MQPCLTFLFWCMLYRSLFKLNFARPLPNFNLTLTIMITQRNYKVFFLSTTPPSLVWINRQYTCVYSLLTNECAVNLNKAPTWSRLEVYTDLLLEEWVCTEGLWQTSEGHSCSHQHSYHIPISLSHMHSTLMIWKVFLKTLVKHFNKIQFYIFFQKQCYYEKLCWISLPNLSTTPSPSKSGPYWQMVTSWNCLQKSL